MQISSFPFFGSVIQIRVPYSPTSVSSVWKYNLRPLFVGSWAMPPHPFGNGRTSNSHDFCARSKLVWWPSYYRLSCFRCSQHPSNRRSVPAQAVSSRNLLSIHNLRDSIHCEFPQSEAHAYVPLLQFHRGGKPYGRCFSMRQPAAFARTRAARSLATSIALSYAAIAPNIWRISHNQRLLYKMVQNTLGAEVSKYE